MIPRSARLIWSAEKSNVEQTVVKIGQSRLSMQADYLKLVVFYKPLQILQSRGKRPYSWKNECKTKKGCKAKLECRKVKCGAKWTKYASCTFSQWYFLSPLRSYQLEVQDQIKINKYICILEKSDLKEWKTNLECRKVKCGANHNKNWAKPTKYASCTFSQ